VSCPNLFGQLDDPLLISVIDEEISGVGIDGSRQPRGGIRLFGPIRIEGGGSLGKEVLHVDAYFGVIQQHHAIGGDQWVLACRGKP